MVSSVREVANTLPRFVLDEERRPVARPESRVEVHVMYLDVPQVVHDDLGHRSWSCCHDPRWSRPASSSACHAASRSRNDCSRSERSSAADRLAPTYGLRGRRRSPQRASCGHATRVPARDGGGAPNADRCRIARRVRARNRRAMRTQASAASGGIAADREERGMSRILVPAPDRASRRTLHVGSAPLPRACGPRLRPHRRGSARAPIENGDRQAC
jgi:hypothetical protein